jgi:hypothetical protein
MGITNENGQVSGLIPSNQTLTLNVYASYYTCGVDNIVYTSSIGPFTINTTLPNIVINNSTTTFTSTVIGNLVKCDNTPVTNGYVFLNRDGNVSLSPVTNGAFNFNEIYCPDYTQFTLKGFDVENLQQTDSISYNFTAPITNIGNLQACTAVDEFISYQIDNNPTIFLLQNVSGGSNIQVGLPSGGLNLYGYSVNNQGLSIWGSTNVPGVYSTSQFSIEGEGVGYIGNTTINTIQFNLSQFGAIGTYIDMTFNGTYQDPNGGNHTITGVVHVIRDN